jgi:hypothetical protein
MILPGVQPTFYTHRPERQVKGTANLSVGLNTAKPILTNYSWEKETQLSDNTGYENGAIYQLWYFHSRFVFKMEVIKRFNQGIKDLNTKGSPVGGGNTFLRPDTSVFEIFPLPSSIPYTDFVNNDKSWRMVNVEIKQELKMDLYELKATFRAETEWKSEHSFDRKIAMPDIDTITEIRAAT